MTQVEQYKAAVKGSHGHWRTGRESAAKVIERIITARACVTVADLMRESRCNKSHATYTLNSMEAFGLLARRRGSGRASEWYLPGDGDPSPGCDVAPLPVKEPESLFEQMRTSRALDGELLVARGRLHLVAVHLHEAARIVERVTDDLRTIRNQHPKHAEDRRALKVLRQITEGLSVNHHQISAAIGIDPDKPLDLHELSRQLEYALDVDTLKQMGKGAK